MKTRWGILSTAKIGVEKVIPAIQEANNCEVVAVSSRDAKKAEKTAKKLGIPNSYGSYEELLADENIDIVYNPMPNHLHVPYTIKALEAGKHVLCEKPIALDTAGAVSLVEEAAKYPGLKVMEAFMYRFHPQWIKTKQLVDEGAIGEVRTIQSFFSYYNDDPENIRNQADIGGGALMDIGCYCISIPRFILGDEPKRVLGLVDRDPVMKTDRLTSGVLDFANGVSSTFTCSTQLCPFQRVQIVGDKGRIEIDIPVNAPANGVARVLLFTADKTEQFKFDSIDQYTKQAEAFANAVLNDTVVPTPLMDAVNNMIVVDAFFESEAQNAWVEI
ncbi:MAG: Gfo/Idh/MocA family oxidoreductase [Prolixibacteraceae bacterium]|nr:Gfo/Idh/MocA family oxidoreductase [Prolixibacteraceae bacterium]